MHKAKAIASEEIQEIKIQIEGLTPLIPHRFSVKTKAMASVAKCGLAKRGAVAHGRGGVDNLKRNRCR